MGPPLRKMQYDRGQEVWWYSESAHSSDYWKRAVSFRAGVVGKFFSGFYID
jgi:hypothetical protein